MTRFMRFWLRLGVVLGLCWAGAVALFAWDALILPGRPYIGSEEMRVLESARVLHLADAGWDATWRHYSETMNRRFGPTLEPEGLSAFLDGRPLPRRPRNWPDLPIALLALVLPMALYVGVGWAINAFFRSDTVLAPVAAPTSPGPSRPTTPSEGAPYEKGRELGSQIFDAIDAFLAKRFEQMREAYFGVLQQRLDAIAEPTHEQTVRALRNERSNFQREIEALAPRTVAEVEDVLLAEWKEVIRMIDPDGKIGAEIRRRVDHEIQAVIIEGTAMMATGIPDGALDWEKRRN